MICVTPDSKERVLIPVAPGSSREVELPVTTLLNVLEMDVLFNGVLVEVLGCCQRIMVCVAFI